MTPDRANLKLIGVDNKLLEVESDLGVKLFDNLPPEQAKLAIAAVNTVMQNRGIRLVDPDLGADLQEIQKAYAESANSSNRYAAERKLVLVLERGDVVPPEAKKFMNELRMALKKANVELKVIRPENAVPQQPVASLPPSQPQTPRTPDATPVTQPAVAPTQPMQAVDVQPQVPPRVEPAPTVVDMQLQRDLGYAISTLELLANRNNPPMLTEADITNPRIHSFLVDGLAAKSGLQNFMQRFSEAPQPPALMETMLSYDKNMVELLGQLFTDLQGLKNRIQLPANFVELLLSVYAADRFARGNMSSRLDTNIPPRAVALVMNSYLQYGWLKNYDTTQAQYLRITASYDPERAKPVYDNLIGRLKLRSGRLTNDASVISELPQDERDQWSELLGFERQMNAETMVLVEKTVYDYVEKYCKLSPKDNPEAVMDSFQSIQAMLAGSPLFITLDRQNHSENPVINLIYEKLRSNLKTKLVPAVLDKSLVFDIENLVNSRSGFKTFVGYMRALRNAAKPGTGIAADIYLELYEFYKSELDDALLDSADDEDLKRFKEYFDQLAWNESDPDSNADWNTFKPFVVKLPIYRQVPNGHDKASREQANQTKEEATDDLENATKNWDERVKVLIAQLEKRKEKLLKQGDPQGKVARINELLAKLKKMDSKEFIPDTAQLIKQMYGFDALANQADQALIKLRGQQLRVLAERSRKINGKGAALRRKLLGRQPFAVVETRVAADVANLEARATAEITAQAAATSAELSSQRANISNANEGLALALGEIENLIAMNPDLKAPGLLRNREPLEADALIAQANAMVIICDKLKARFGPNTYKEAMEAMQQELLKFNNGFIDRVAGDENLKVLLLGAESQIDGELQAADRVKRLTPKNIISEGLKAA